MAIHDSSVIESSSGFTKEIDAGSMHMALDVLQKFQYQYPQKSTIRELAANAVDSIKERDIAKLILTGQAKEEDYYIRRDSAEFKDSNFNPDYFDLDWLSDKKDVEIIYEEGDGINRKDRLRVIDSGVGLGGRRLEVYFKLNASTKRNSKSAIGKWGLGAKVGLSTGVDSYRVITRHNGREYAFDVYSHKVDSVTEKFDEHGNINPTYTFENGYTCYYKVTKEKNGTEVIIETKKHHRSQYTDAVRSQLLHFDNVVYKVHREDGYEQIIPTKANVIYQDEDIILSENNQYSKPYIVINNVCYGYIDFLELELENKTGNIGIKMEAEMIDISPSRESIIWGDKTRKTVTDKFAKVVDIASKEVEKNLAETDFLKWISKCNTVLTSYDNYSILGRLSRVVEKSTLKPTYPLNKSIKYKGPKEMFWGLNAREVTTRRVNKGGKIYEEVDRGDMYAWGALEHCKVYYTSGTANNIKDRYLISLSRHSRIILVQMPEEVSEEKYKERNKELTPEKLETQWKEYQQRRAETLAVMDLIKISENAVNYDTVVVPEDFAKKIEEAEKEVEAAIIVAQLTPAELRKQDERTVLYYLHKMEFSRYLGKTDANGQALITNFSWIKDEPKISEVIAWEGNVIYCFGDEDEMLLSVAWLLNQQCTKTTLNTRGLPVFTTSYFTDDVKLVRVSKSIKKYFKNHTHVSEFFKTVNGTELSMNNLFVNWYTAKRIFDGLNTVSFLTNFSAFNQEIHDKYLALRAYQNQHYVNLAPKIADTMLGCTPAAMNAICAYADKAAELQIYISEHPDGEIAEKSKEILGAEYTGVTGIDLEQYKVLKEVLEYAEPLKNILNYVTPLTDTKITISFELESEIKEIMKNKGYA